MLQRHIDVVADRRGVGKDSDHLLGPERRIGIHEPQPLDALHVGQSLHQRHQVRSAVQILSVAHRILRHQHEFAHAAGREPLGLGDEVLDGLALMAPANGRDGAKRAFVIAAVGDAQISPVAGCQGQSRQTVHIALSAPAAEQAVDIAHDVGLLFQRQDLVGFLGQLAAQIDFVALRQAARNDHPSAAPALPQAVGLQDGVDGLLLGRADESTGVDDDDIGFERLSREAVVVALQQSQHALGVHRVLGAPQADEVDLVYGCGRRHR